MSFVYQSAWSKWIDRKLTAPYLALAGLVNLCDSRKELLTSAKRSLGHSMSALLRRAYAKTLSIY